MNDYKELIEELRAYARPAELDEHYAMLEAANMLTELRNELCYRCGQYATAHLGSCDGCKWRNG